jgi:acetyl esterase/lipase
MLSAILLALSFTLAQAATDAPPDWARILRLREAQVLGKTLTTAEEAELRHALLKLDSRQQVAIATRLALVGLTGDGVGEVFNVPPVAVAESPVLALTTTATDGQPVNASYRKPPGAGPFPAVVILHGGLQTQSAAKRQWFLENGPVHTRLLAAGYLVVQATFRDYSPRNLQLPGPTLDAEAAYLATRKLPFVDPRRVFLFGGSGGGSLALEVASLQKPAAVIAGEPATILYAGMLTTGAYEPRLRMMADPAAYYLPEHQQLLQTKLKRISCPVLLLSGDIHPLKVMNREIFLPAARAAGVDIRFSLYPGEGHGFYFGSATSAATVEKVLAEILSFLKTAAPGPER